MYDIWDCHSSYRVGMYWASINSRHTQFRILRWLWCDLMFSVSNSSFEKRNAPRTQIWRLRLYDKVRNSWKEVDRNKSYNTL